MNPLVNQVRAAVDAWRLRGFRGVTPTTRKVLSDSTDQIALWTIDTAYDEESFFVRHCYFTGGNDPFKRLKTALRRTSMPTPGRACTRPSPGRSSVRSRGWSR